MAYRLVISEDASRDIDGIAVYIADRLRNPPAASGFLDDVGQCYLRIVNNPHLYSVCNDERLRRKDYRKVALKNYLMLYQVDEIEKVVRVVRIVYGTRNYSVYL